MTASRLSFEPAGDGGGQDRILTSVRLRAPQLGLTLNVEPRLSLHVVEHGGESLIELRFEEVPLALPLGSVDLAGMLPPLRYPAQNLFLLAGAQEDVEVLSRVTGVKMERESLQFRISLEVPRPAAGSGGG